MARTKLLVREYKESSKQSLTTGVHKIEYIMEVFKVGDEVLSR